MSIEAMDLGSGRIHEKDTIGYYEIGIPNVYDVPVEAQEYLDDGRASGSFFVDFVDAFNSGTATENPNEMELPFLWNNRKVKLTYTALPEGEIFSFLLERPSLRDRIIHPISRALSFVKEVGKPLRAEKHFYRYAHGRRPGEAHSFTDTDYEEVKKILFEATH